MAADMFLKITDIKGESKDSQHKDEIEIESYSFGLNQTGTSSHGQGLGGGKVSFHDMTLVARHGKAAPFLFIDCANGKHHTEAKLTCRKAGGKQEKYLEITMHDVLISTYVTGNSTGNEIPMDTFSLNFSKVEFDYHMQNEKGGTTSAGKKEYDLKANKGK